MIQAENALRRSRALWLTWVSVGLAIIVAVIVTSPVEAVSRSPRNSFEQRAYQRCLRDPGLSIRGALWVSNQDSYYGERVVIGPETEFVRASFRGSFVYCTHGSGVTIRDRDMYATKIVPRGPGSNRLRELDQSVANCQNRPGYAPCFYRGSFAQHYMPRYSSDWSSQGRQLNVTIDVRGLAMSPSGYAEFSVDLYRCPGGGSWPTGGSECYSDPQIIKIERRPPPALWTVAGRSTVTNQTRGSGPQTTVRAKPGDEIVFDHSLRNSSEYRMNRDVRVLIDHTENGRAIQPEPGPSGWQGRGAAGQTFFQQRVPLYNKQQYRVKPEDVGKTLCQRVAWRPGAWNDGEWGSSQQACVTIDHEYTLQPVISVSDTTLPEGTYGVSGITASITNHGPTKSQALRYAVARFVVRGNTSVELSGGEVATNEGDWPCAVVRELGRRAGVRIDDASCRDKWLVRRDDGTVVQLGGLNVLSNASNSISDITPSPSAADRLCYVTIISHYTHQHGAQQFRYSTPACVQFMKKPKVQFWGGDVRAGGGFDGRRGNAQADIYTSITRMRR